MGRPRNSPEGEPQPRQAKAKTNRIEINDEGVRVLVEIDGLTATRAAQVMQAVLDLVFSGNTVGEFRGSVLDKAREGGGPEIEEPPGGIG